MRRLTPLALVLLTSCFGIREAPPCVVDADCAYERICVQQACTDPPVSRDPVEPPPPTGCRDDSDCARGERCDLGACVEAERSDVCATDAECAPAQICEASTCVDDCNVAPCEVGFVCDGSRRCVPRGECPTDRFEPNDASDAAVAIGDLEAGLRACADADFFRLDLAAGDEATVQIDYTASEGRVGLTLAGESVNVTTEPGLASFTFAAPRDDSYAIRVVLEEDLGVAPGAQYNLLTEVAWGACADDAEEPNDSAAEGTRVEPGRYTDLAQCEDNDDWFVVAGAVDDTLQLTIDFEHAEADLALELFDPSGASVAVADSSTDDEQLTYVVTTPGDHALRVHLVDDGGRRAGAPYGLQVTRTEPLRCVADAMEPNDTLLTAAPAALDTPYTATACGESDYYAFTTATPLTIQAAFTHAEGDVDLELFDPNGTSVALAASQDDDETLVVTSTGAYVLRVQLASDGGNAPGNDYTLQLATSGCAPDTFEPNDAVAAAAPVAFGAHAGLTMCEADADYYQFDLAAGQGVDIDLSFLHAEGDIDVELSTLSGTLLSSATSGDDDETILFSTQVGGTYVLRVYLYADAGSDPGNTYDLSLVLR
ncbi:MAG: pre-peptidase C-terminal domain-containing protein [Deltaproteobacteria bacterium]